MREKNNDDIVNMLIKNLPQDCHGKQRYADDEEDEEETKDGR